MAEKYPRDSFDDLPTGMKRAGTHRMPPPPGFRWVRIAQFTAVAVLLIGFGIGSVFFVQGLVRGGGSDGGDLSTEALPAAQPTLDPTVPVAVLNGTGKQGLAATAGKVLTDAGLKIALTANANSSDITQTMVYYTKPELEAAARGVAERFSGAGVQQSDQYKNNGTDIVVLLGSDYKAS